MDDMHLLIDEHTAERLVSGMVAPDDAPPGYARLASLVRAARAPGSPNELVGGGAVASMAAAIVSNTLTPAASREGAAPGSKRLKMFSRIVTAKAATLAMAAMFGLGTAAAAATGTLPLQGSGGAVQRTTAVQIANASSGATISKPAAGGTGAGSTTGAATTTSSGPSSTINAGLTGPANQHALFGLCTAFLAGNPSTGTASSDATSAAQSGGTASTTGTGTAPGGKYNSTAFRALISEAGGSVASATAACGSFLQGPSAPSSASIAGGSSSGTADGSGHPPSPGKSASHANGHGHTASASRAHAR